ncbi:MAG: hypothetical protein U0931_23750 [Vulcanimicrobiota bacterium]
MCKNCLFWMLLVLCLRLIIWVNPGPTDLQVYDVVLCLALISKFCASSRPHAFLDL